MRQKCLPFWNNNSVRRDKIKLNNMVDGKMLREKNNQRRGTVCAGYRNFRKSPGLMTRFILLHSLKLGMYRATLPSPT